VDGSPIGAGGSGRGLCERGNIFFLVRRRLSLAPRRKGSWAKRERADGPTHEHLSDGRETKQKR